MSNKFYFEPGYQPLHSNLVNIAIFRFEYGNIQIWIWQFSDLNMAIFRFEYGNIQIWIWQYSDLNMAIFRFKYMAIYFFKRMDSLNRAFWQIWRHLATKVHKWCQLWEPSDISISESWFFYIWYQISPTSDLISDERHQNKQTVAISKATGGGGEKEVEEVWNGRGGDNSLWRVGESRLCCK